MLATSVALHDVQDVQAFVVSTLHRTNLTLSHDEREELVLEGLGIMVKLAARYEPHRDGYDQPGSFAGYCSRYLGGKLLQAWHRLNPEHCRIRDGGRERWLYFPRTLSYEGVMNGAGGMSVSDDDDSDQPMRHPRDWLPIPTPALAATSHRV